jgi:hypothetical protein
VVVAFDVRDDDGMSFFATRYDGLAAANFAQLSHTPGPKNTLQSGFDVATFVTTSSSFVPTVAPQLAASRNA